MRIKILNSIKKFNLNLNGKTVLTEAATGEYAVTPIIAALAGAKVIALAKESTYGSYAKIQEEIYQLSSCISNRNLNITIIRSFEEIFTDVDIVTNSGFVRPINKQLQQKLTKNSVITLMYEPWEFRETDVDIEQALKNEIKVYGTNEHDSRLQTMEYIGLTALYHLLNLRITHFSEKKILLIGNNEFIEPINKVLIVNSYNVEKYYNYNLPILISDYDILIIAENKNPILLVGNNGIFDKEKLNSNQTIIHICGSVDFNNVLAKCIPPIPKPFGYMSFRTDYIDNQALIDLQTGSLSVAQGMLEANKLGLIGSAYKIYMESNYPALSFADSRLW